MNIFSPNINEFVAGMNIIEPINYRELPVTDIKKFIPSSALLYFAYVD